MMVRKMNRQEDLSKVFDRTWAANHNDVAKRGREREKKFMDKMFNTNTANKGSSNVNRRTPGSEAERLQNNINGAFSGYRQANLNNIVKKWK